MPTNPKIVSLYLTHLSKTSKISTLRRRLVSIGVVHKLKGHYLDTKHPAIIENLMGIKRIKGSKQILRLYSEKCIKESSIVLKAWDAFCCENAKTRTTNNKKQGQKTRTHKAKLRNIFGP